MPTRGMPLRPKRSAAVGCSRSPPGKGIVAHREAGSVLHAYVEMNRPAEWIAGIDFADTTAATVRIAAEFEGWAPELTALITDGEAEPVPRMIHALPIGHRWDRVPGVTLLGDAAHLMPPAGEGANLALFDGAELGEAIAAHRGDSEAALTAYEEALFPRSEAAAVDAHRILALCLDDRAPFSLCDVFTGTLEAENAGSRVVPIQTAPVHPTCRARSLYRLSREAGLHVPASGLALAAIAFSPCSRCSFDISCIRHIETQTELNAPSSSSSSWPSLSSRHRRARGPSWRTRGTPPRPPSRRRRTNRPRPLLRPRRPAPRDPRPDRREAPARLRDHQGHRGPCRWRL